MNAPAVLDGRRCVLGEGPTFDAVRNRLWWVDILGRCILWQDLQSGDIGSFDTEDLVGAVVLRKDGDLTACLKQTVVTLDADNGTVLHSLDLPVTHTSAAVPLRMNDAKCAPDGHLFAGSMFIDEIPGCEGAGALYRISRGTIQTAVAGITLSNGLGWSPDGTVMYYVDTRTQRIDQFDYALESGPCNRRPFAIVQETDGNPDGLCVDAEGGVWVALWGGAKVHRYDSDGGLAHVVDVPTRQPTSVCFYGEGLTSLAITTAALGHTNDDLHAGRTYTVSPGVAGCPVARFNG